jgi:predicted lipid-binding transport protein (Tim44 family)
MKRWIALTVFIFSLIVSSVAFSRGGGGCFLPTTLILRADGSSVAINQVQPGDKLQAYDNSGKILTTKVKAVLTHQVDSYFVVSTDKMKVNVTGEHPFYVGNNQYKTIESLSPGDVIYALDAGKLTQQSIRHIEQVKAKIKVYNLQTDDPHTYFAAGFAVHNKGGGGGGGCFPPGTQVETPTGYVAIESLTPGDSVITIDKVGRIRKSKVETTFATTSNLLIINTDQGTLKTTDEHPLALSTGGFVRADKLSPQDAIVFEKQGKLLPAIIQSVQKKSESLVFNLQVQSPHTFIADGFLVHNKGGFSGSSGSGGGQSACRPGDTKCETRTTLMTLLFIGFWIYLVFFGKLVKKDENENLDFSYSRQQIQKKSLKTMKLLHFIARQDQSMNPELLVKVTRSVFLKLQSCWMSRDYAPMKELMMPDLFIQHNRQIEGMIRNHEINILDDLRIKMIDLVNVRYTEKKAQREFTALITASAIDKYIDDRTKKFVRGDRAPAEFQEFWTFQLQDDKWLLREIEQTRESSILKDENFFEQYTDKQVEKIYQDDVDDLGVAGPWLEKPVLEKTNKVERMLNFLAQSDRLWDRQAMLARVREVFNNLHMAIETGELNATVRDQLYPSVAEHCDETIAEQKKLGESTEYRNFCVRKVEILLVRSFSDKNQDEFVSRISAHAQRIHRRGDTILTQDKDVTPFEEYWTFGRLDNQWKLKEPLPQAEGQRAIGSENIEEDTSPDLVKWYYTKKRAL